MKSVKFFAEKSLKPLLIAAAVVLAAALCPVIFSDINLPLDSCFKNVYPTSDAKVPYSPTPSDSGEHNGSLQVAIPGSTVPVVVSRRNHDQLTLREFRDGDTGVIVAQSVQLVLVAHLKNHEKIKKSLFQSFLKHSLPPRAGPAAV